MLLNFSNLNTDQYNWMYSTVPHEINRTHTYYKWMRIALIAIQKTESLRSIRQVERCFLSGASFLVGAAATIAVVVFVDVDLLEFFTCSRRSRQWLSESRGQLQRNRAQSHSTQRPRVSLITVYYLRLVKRISNYCTNQQFLIYWTVL